MRAPANTVKGHQGENYPGLLDMASFLVRSKGLQIKRTIVNAVAGSPRLPAAPKADFPFVLAESISPLHTSASPRERPLVLGKIQNLRRACRQINHRFLAAGEVFSFWRQVGPPWRWRGFATGREVREGCVIPTVGGGLCQLSGSLLEVALALDCELVERHRHTALPADVSHDVRRDATLFWNYVDLRFRSPVPILFEAHLTEDALIVRLRGKVPRDARSSLITVSSEGPRKPILNQSCHTCHQAACLHHHGAAAMNGRETHSKTAFLVDEYQPEFENYIQQQAGRQDLFLIPYFSGDRGPGWSARSFKEPRAFPLFRFWRSWKLRWAVSRGITVAKAHFEVAEALARIYARNIPPDVEHLCVAQTLVPHLWRAGLLGGRTFDVLMHRLPVVVLQRQLDQAARLYPQSRTLIEFRAPQWFAEAEEEALKSARRVVTPHPQIAALFNQSVRLAWEPPANLRTADGLDTGRDLIVFLGPALARKGAYAVREAARKIRFALTVLGADLEAPDFWKDLSVTRSTWQQLPWERVHTVLQPALLEYWPRQLLRAHATGSRLVISPLCGLEEDPARGIHHVPFGDTNALVATMEKLRTNQGDLLCV